MKTSSKLLKAITLSVALLGGTAIVSTVVTPDSAWAGNGIGKGGGNDKSDRGNGNGGGKDKADRGKGKSGGKDKSTRGNGRATKTEPARGSGKQAARGNGNSKANSRSTGSSYSDDGSHTLNGLSRNLKRDVKALFTRDSKAPKSWKKSSTKSREASVQPLKASPRPAARDLDARPHHGHGDKADKKHLRDPLVAAITDPDGSDKLRNLNAAKAASAAFANAAPNSNVGRIATYQAAAEEYYGLRDDLKDARSDLRDFEDDYEGRTSEEILDDIAELEPSDPNYESDLEDLETELAEAEEFEEELDELRKATRDLRRETVVASKDAEAAFYSASKGATLTEETLADLHSILGLPVPTP